MTCTMPIPNSEDSITIELPENLGSFLRELFIPARKEAD